MERLKGLFATLFRPSGTKLRAHLRAASAGSDAWRLLAERSLFAIARTPAIGYDIAIALDPEDALSIRAEAALKAADGDRATLWLARLQRERGKHDEAFAAFEQVITADDTSLARDALLDAANLALRRSHYVKRHDLIERAVATGLTPEPAWRLAAVRSIVTRPALPDPPTIAFDRLVDEILPVTPRYAPRNALLMIGNTLGCGGMERILANSFRAMKAGAVFDEVHLGLVRFDPAGETGFYRSEADVAEGDVTILASDAVPHPAIATLPFPWIGRAQAVYELVAARRPRVVHAWNDLTGLIASFAALLAGAPRVIVHFHHMRPVTLKATTLIAEHYPACYRRLAERPEMEFLFCAGAARDDYADFWGVAPDARWHVLHNGFFLEPARHPRETGAAKTALGLDPARPVIGSVFRFDAVKQPLLWAEAAITIHAARRDVQVLMVGGGGVVRDEVAARLADAGVAALFPGQVRDVPAYLAAMDLMLMTSRTEGLPNGAVEGQFAGVPLVAFDVGGTRETIVAGQTGRLVPPGDTAALAAAAVDWLDDPAGLAEAGRAASAHAASAFAMDGYLANLEALYGAFAGAGR